MVTRHLPAAAKPDWSERQPFPPLSEFNIRDSIGLLIRGTGIAFALQVTGTALGYFVQVLLARWLGPQEYGTYTYIFTWAQSFALISLLGLDVAILRFVPEYIALEDHAHLQGILKWSRQLSILVGSFFMISIAAGYLFFRPTSPEILAVLAGTVLIPLLALSELQSQTLRGRQKIAWAFFPPLILLPICLVAFANILHQTVPLSFGTLTLGAMAIALLVVLGVQSGGIRGWFLPTVPPVNTLYETRRWLKISLPLLVNTFFSIILLRMDVLMVGMLMGASEAGIYSVAAKTATIISFPLLATNAIIAPLVASFFARRDKNGLQEVVRWATFGSFWASVLMGTGLLVISGPLLGFFGEPFQQARFPLAILIFGQWINVGFGPVGLLLTLTGYEKNSVRILGWTAGLNIALCLGLIPWLGLLGAAVTSTVSMAIWNAWMYRTVAQKLDIRPSFLFIPKFRKRGEDAS
jgi:O-antigen/teichoic acid export membrane protein